MYLPNDPQQLEAVRESIRRAVMERDVYVALVFFLLEAILLAWLLPWFLDPRAEKREESRRVPTRRIATERIVDSIRDLLRAAQSLHGALSVANSAAGTQDLFDKAQQEMDKFKEQLGDITKRMTLISSGKPLPNVPAQNPNPPDPEKGAKAKNQRRLNLNKNLFIERNVAEVTQAIEDTQKAIDAFLPVFSVEMIECATKLYQQLAVTEKPFRALKQAFLNSNDKPSVQEANDAAVDARELLPALKNLCDLIGFDTSKLANEFQYFPDAQDQKDKMQTFLYLHFEGSYYQDLIDIGLR